MGTGINCIFVKTSGRQRAVACEQKQNHVNKEFFTSRAEQLASVTLPSLHQHYIAPIAKLYCVPFCENCSKQSYVNHVSSRKQTELLTSITACTLCTKRICQTVMGFIRRIIAECFFDSLWKLLKTWWWGSIQQTLKVNFFTVGHLMAAKTNCHLFTTECFFSQ